MIPLAQSHRQVGVSRIDLEASFGSCILKHLAVQSYFSRTRFVIFFAVSTRMAELKLALGCQVASNQEQITKDVNHQREKLIWQ
jgi:hypothetical protein